MKKTLVTTFLLLTTLLLVNCSGNDDNFDSETFQKVQGKWKLTSYFTDNIILDENGNPQDMTISNGYELELKADKTFTSNEIAGFTGGTYTVIESPGTNLKLVYINGTHKLVRYKYIVNINESELDVSYSEVAPINNSAVFFEFLTLTHIP